MDDSVRCPFVIAVDSGEGAPWTFQGILADAKLSKTPWVERRELFVETQRWCLGRHPDSRGDYSIVGLFDEVGIERKSVEDIQSTVLGWTTPGELKHEIVGRRDRFKSELANLASLKCKAVIVEGELTEVLDTMPAYGSRSAEQNRMHFNRSMLSWGQKFHVPWYFLTSRRHAEVEAFRLMDWYWRNLSKSRQRELRQQTLGYR